MPPEPAPSAFDTLMREVDALPPGGAGRAEVRRLILRFAGQRIYVPRAALRAERIAHAARLLAAGEPRALIAMRLRAVYGLGRTAAYDLIASALALPRR